MLRRYATSIVILLLAAAGGWAWRASAQRTSQPRVPVARVTHGEFVVSLLAEGPLESDDLVVVRTGKAAGELTMIVPEGTVVKEGDVVCEIEARELLRKKADQELSYKQAMEGIENTREMAEERVDSDQRALRINSPTTARKRIGCAWSTRGRSAWPTRATSRRRRPR